MVRYPALFQQTLIHHRCLLIKAEVASSKTSLPAMTVDRAAAKPASAVHRR